MALNVNALVRDYKSAGVYTIEVDNSQRFVEDDTALRLLVGFAGKGPFNRPVYLEDDADRQKVFGNIDEKLEHKGCYFNRFAQTMLREAPIFALNLLYVDDSPSSPDKVNWAAMSLNSAVANPVISQGAGQTFGEYDYIKDTHDKNIYGNDTMTDSVIPFVGATQFAGLYDRSKFWIPSPENLTLTAATAFNTGDVTSFEHTNFFNMANVGTEEFSVLVFKPENLKGFDITVAEWYGGKENIPFGWLRPYDYISDYFLQVICVKGNWTNYPSLSVDPIWNGYFDEKGIIKTRINNFLAAEGIELLGSWTGIIIPDFVDKQGVNQNLFDKINKQTETTGLMVSFNLDAAQTLTYDYNGADNEEGNSSNTTGCWFIDADENGQMETANGEISADTRFLIDMVGHNYHDSVYEGKTSYYLVNQVKFSSENGGRITLTSANSDNYVFSFNGDVIDPSVYIMQDNSLSGINFSTSTRNTNITLDSKLHNFIKATDAQSRYTSKITVEKNTVNPMTIYEDVEVAAQSETPQKKTSKRSAKIQSLYGASGQPIETKYLFTTTATTTITLIPLAKVADYADYTKVAWAGKEDGKWYIFKATFIGSAGADKNNPGVYNWEKVTEITDNLIEWKYDEYGAASSLYTDDSKVNYLYFYPLSDELLFTISNDLNDYKNSKLYVTANTELYKGINFLSYNFIEKEDDSTLVYEIPGILSAKTLGISEVDTVWGCTDYTACNIEVSVGDYVYNKVINNAYGEAQQYNMIPGVTRIVSKVFVPVTGVISDTNAFAHSATVTNGVFSYKNKVYDYEGAVIYDENFGTCGFYLFTTLEQVLISDDNKVTRQLPISSDVISHSLRFIPMKGLKLSARHKPGYDKNGVLSIEGGIEKIYGMLMDNGILRGLCNPEMVDYRYVVDSMSHGIGDELGGKVYLSKLAMARGKTTALLNMPSKKQFGASVNPYFCDSYINGVTVKPAFDTKYIPMGGNAELYSTSLFSLPTEEDGSKFTACFWPNLEYTVRGKKLSVPPAADVSNTFIRKFMGGNPYGITANLNGLISNPYVTGVEYDADTTDRDYLEPFGVNTIIRRRGQVMIYGNQTAYQKVKSDMCKLHVRECINTIEINCERILHNYNFAYNTAVLRAAVVTALTPVLQAVQESGAIDSYTIVCDETNNTEEVIAESMGIVDINLWFNMGMEKIIQRITVNRSFTSDSNE